VHLAAPSTQNNVIGVTSRASKAKTFPERDRGGQVVECYTSGQLGVPFPVEKEPL
jgi:hypothetical protein